MLTQKTLEPFPGRISQKWEMIPHLEPAVENFIMAGDRCQVKLTLLFLVQFVLLPLMLQSTRYLVYLDMAVR